MKSKWMIVVAMACVLSAGFAAAAEPEFEWKFNSTVPEGHHLTIGTRELGDEIQRRSGGRIVVHTYGGGQLATGERESVEGLQFGTIDGTNISGGSIGIYDQDFFMFSLPYLFRDEHHAWNAIDNGGIGETLAKKLEDQGLKVASWGMSGLHIMTCNKPVNSMADLKGMKIRCMENPLIMDAWRAYGAVPTPMSIGEVFTALQQGTVDGQDGSTANSAGNKYWEVTKYMVMTGHMVQPILYLISKAKYDALPDDLKQIVDEAAAAANEKQRAEYLRQAAAAEETMKSHGMTITYPDKADFIKAAAAVYDKYLPDMSDNVKGWVADIQAGKY